MVCLCASPPADLHDHLYLTPALLLPNRKKAIHDAFVQLLGRVPDQSGLSHYHAQLTGNHSISIQHIRRNIASSKEANEYRRRLGQLARPPSVHLILKYSSRKPATKMCVQLLATLWKRRQSDLSRRRSNPKRLPSLRHGQRRGVCYRGSHLVGGGPAPTGSSSAIRPHSTRTTRQPTACTLRSRPGNGP